MRSMATTGNPSGGPARPLIATRIAPVGHDVVKILSRLRNRSAQGEAGAGAAAANTSRSRPLPAMDARRRQSPFDRVDVARDERNELARLRDEARYRRERLELYRARLYGGRATSQGKLRELQRASDGAAARLRGAEAAATPAQHTDLSLTTGAGMHG